MTALDSQLSVEERVADEDLNAYKALLSRLSHQSVVKHFDAYTDIEWDSRELAIDPDDPRWELGPDDSLGATGWYRSLPQPARARLGLDLIASKMKMGLEFESVLKRGLLEFASTLPNGSPEFRYAYHEVIEEAQHSLMFQEFVNRSGFDAAGLRALDRLGSRRIVKLGRRFPALFFVFVLGGEDPIDYVQRRELRNGRTIHPLLERIMRIHVTEEARHLSFTAPLPEAQRAFVESAAPGHAGSRSPARARVDGADDASAQPPDREAPPHASLGHPRGVHTQQGSPRRGVGLHAQAAQALGRPRPGRTRLPTPVEAARAVGRSTRGTHMSLARRESLGGVALPGAFVLLVRPGSCR